MEAFRFGTEPIVGIGDGPQELGVVAGVSARRDQGREILRPAPAVEPGG